MIFGISLFLRLVQVTLRPAKAHFPAPPAACAATITTPSTARPAATVLNIPDDGLD